MNNWKEELQSKIKTRLYSEGIKNYNDVTEKFKSQFSSLVRPVVGTGVIPAIDASIDDDYATFSIFERGLVVYKNKEDGTIWVNYKEGNSDMHLGKVVFEEGYAYFVSDKENSKQYLRADLIDSLFEKAFKSL